MADSKKTCGMSERTDITAITHTQMLMREGNFKLLTPILLLLAICCCALPAQGKLKVVNMKFWSFLLP